MSNDNLILFPNKSTSNISMSENEAKWMIAGSLLLVLTMAIGVNASLFSSSPQQAPMMAEASASQGSRVIASINPIFRVSWEKKAFEVLKETKARDLATVGKKPSVFDNFAFATLDGHYTIRKVEGKILEVQFAEAPESLPKALKKRHRFLMENLKLFSDQATAVEQVQSLENDERFVEKYVMKSQAGQDLGQIEILLDKDHNLLSMIVR